MSRENNILHCFAIVISIVSDSPVTMTTGGVAKCRPFPQATIKAAMNFSDSE